MNQPQMIILHHSAGYDHPVIPNWEGIREYHKKVRGWRDIGYHYGIELVDHRAVIRYGRKPYEVGAHAPGSNAKSLGICILGDFSEHTPDLRLILRLLELLKSLIKAFNIDRNAIYGHYEVMRPGYTECPGKMFPLEKIKNWVTDNV